MSAWFIDSIEVVGGFLDSVALRLPPRPSLICVIGPRGSGKSTLTEAVRYALAGAPNPSKPRLDLLQANLSSALITLKTSMDPAGRAYVVTRRFRAAAMVTTPDGRPLMDVDIDRGTFLPLDAYGSQEIEQIADETLGARRRVLLDELQVTEFRELLHSLTELRRALEANADAIRLHRTKVKDLSEEADKIGDAPAKLAALPPAPPDQDASALTGATRQQQLDLKESAALKAALGRVDRLEVLLRQALGDAGKLIPPGVRVEGSANTAVVAQIDEALVQARDAVLRALTAATGAIESGREQVRAAEATLVAAHARNEVSLRQHQSKSADMSQAVQQRVEAQQAVQRLQAIAEERGREEAEIRRLENERVELKGRYLLERERVSESREHVAAELSKEAGRRVRIQVHRNADSQGYKQLLVDALRGSGLRNFEEITETLLRLRPEELADIVNRNSVEDLRLQTSYPQDRCRKIMDAFKARLDTLALEVVESEDRVAIELNVGTHAEPNFKDAAAVSRGQKCTALLPMLLARRDVPLIIDQPEDNLDNHFIYETVVESILRQKKRRQMIFVTHNANIPVLGDADLVVVLDSDGKRGSVMKSGTVEECRTEIVNLLEGGKKAFELRRKRYGH
jgi:ABC-type cobalamin/Fe3+-siderophores transport system ATPase subunit